MQALQSSVFQNYAKHLFNELQGDESLSLSLSGEETLFTRLSQAKIRQITNLEQAFVEFNFIKGNRTTSFTLPFTGSTQEIETAIKKLKETRTWIEKLPEDPYLVRPGYYGVTKEEALEELPSSEEMLTNVLSSSTGVDLAGVFSSGDIVRASVNSAGQFHWFKTRNFYLDYSLYNEKQKAVKGLFASRVWDPSGLRTNLQESEHKLSLMNREPKKIERGTYRVFLAPSAVSELLGTLSWGGVSMGAHKRGNGSLRDLWEGKTKLSEKFSLAEDFSLGLSPRFNDRGEVSPSHLPLIEKGEFKNFLTSSRTANEYQVDSNNASDWESMRSPSVSLGTLSRDKILKELGTGLYLSDLHYLNWSDRETARVTGMTRYACFWVENGEIVCPIQDLRFDESYYNLFGRSLVDLTDFAEIIPSTGTYSQRDLGGSKVPGILVNEFKFTL